MLQNFPPEFFESGAWLWELFGKEILDSSISNAKIFSSKQWQKVEWSRAAKRYRQRVYDLYSTMRMLGNPMPVSVEGIFTELFIYDKPQALLRYDIHRMRVEVDNKDFYNDKVRYRINAIKAIEENNKLFVLGKPGAGKTTLLKYITLMAAKGKIDLVPIFVSLHDWSQSGLSLIRFIEKQFEICDFPDAEVFIIEALLKKNRAIILFDGLDEVNEQESQRYKVTREIEEFSNQYSNNKYLITCRVAANDYSFEKFSYVELADFSPSQVKIFVEKWFTNQLHKSDLFMEELNKEENHGLRELAQTPILLNLLCLNFDETLYFPARLVDLYQEAIDALLKKWDASRNIKRDEIYRALSVTRKQQLLAQIAAEYFEAKEILFHEYDLIKKVDKYLITLPGFQEDIEGGSILKAIEAQHGLLVERAHRIHSFSHLTFQEFFVARYIIESGSEKVIQQLMVHIGDKFWHEVFLMVVSLLPNADNFFLAFDNGHKNNMGYSFPIKLSRMLRILQSLPPTKRLLYFYLSSAYKLDIEKEINSIQELTEDLIKNCELEDYKNIEKKGLKLSGVVKKLKTPIDGRIIPYALLETLDSLRVPLSYFMQSGTLPSERNSPEKIILVVDDIYMKIKDQINKLYKLIEDILSNAKKARENLEWISILESNELSGQDEKYQENLLLISKLKKLYQELSKLIVRVVSLKNKINETVEFPFSIEGADWIFNEMEIHEILDYLYTQKLLLECLRHASVSNRKKVIESMFLVV